MNGRVARGTHIAEASRILPVKRGERPCNRDHDTVQMRDGATCPSCGAVK